MTDSTTRVRAGLGIFARSDRALLEVRGADRVRWLDGMLTQDVKRLAARGEGAGAHALFLTHRGAIVADLRVGIVGETLVLECERSELDPIREALAKRIIADEVELSDRLRDQDALGIEGPGAEAVLAGVLEAGSPPADGHWLRSRIAGSPVLVAAIGWSGERAYQLHFAPTVRGDVEAALEAAAAGLGVDCVRGDASLQEILRVEAGIPRQGSELDEEVLPPEARLESAIATNKGCYVGQEIVARLRSRGQVNHLLVGLRLAGGAAPERGARLSFEGRAIGELTSVVDSPSEGRIALGYVRREQAEPGLVLEVEGAGRATVSALPFVPLRAHASDDPAARAGAVPGAAGGAS